MAAVTQPRRESVDIGVTYWSAEVGPYIWHEFDRVRTAAELQRIAATGHRVVRTLLAWDAFMPSSSTVDDARLRDFEAFLEIAAQSSLRVMPVLFAQSLAGSVMLPSFAVDVARPRAGVRVLTAAVEQPGGPRDQYTDPLMIDAESIWLEAMLSGFAGHPALFAWDLGHDPASVVRPRRIADLPNWAATMSTRVRERGERCTLTLGSADVSTARAVRPALLAPALDMLGLAIDLKDAALFDDSTGSGRRAVFTSQLAMRLAGGDVALDAHLGFNGAAQVADAIDGLVDAGCIGIFAAVWSGGGPRTASVPPFDRHPELHHSAVVDASGELTESGATWTEHVAQEQERRPMLPWPDTLEADTYYANLPDSLTDLRAAWEREVSDRPAMLE
jgi:hypothetical protein